MKHFYIYDSLNRLVKDYIYRWGYGKFLIAYETLYNYDNKNKLVEKKEYSVFLNPNPELIGSEKFEYDNNSNLIGYSLKKRSSLSASIYNLAKQIQADSNGNVIKEWYNLQTIDLAFSGYLPDTVYYNYNSNSKKIKETRMFTSDLTNKEFTTDTQKNVYLNQFQTNKTYYKIEQEILFYDQKLRLEKIEFYIGTEINNLVLNKIKMFEY